MVINVFKIEMEQCSPVIDVTVSPFADDVFFHPQILALGVKFPMNSFVRDVLVHFKVLPSQLTLGACQIVLGFETHFATYDSDHKG